MDLTSLTAVSPLDGRYAAKLAPLRPIMSELGYMQRRVQVELAWFIALSDAGFDEFKPLSGEARAYLAELLRDFSEADGAASFAERAAAGRGGQPGQPKSAAAAAGAVGLSGRCGGGWNGSAGGVAGCAV